MKPSVPETLLDFQNQFPDEAACEQYLFRWRWPNGFHCPRCSERGAWRLRRRLLYQCKSCRYQASVTAGTAMHRSKLALRTWFWAIFLVGRHKKSISALQLQSDLGLGSYRTAWLLLHKIRACFDEREDFPLRGEVEVDETLVGACMKGDRPGKDPGHKSIVVAGVELRERSMGSLRMAHVPDYTSDSLAGFVRRHVAKGSHVHTDGWAAYDCLSREGYRRSETISSHQPRGGRHVLSMTSIHTVFGNLKTWLTGRFHGVSPKYLPAYLAEFTYRFNRRSSPSNLFGWVARRLMQRSALTLTALQAAEAST
jgi:hypothetical protein